MQALRKADAQPSAPQVQADIAPTLPARGPQTAAAGTGASSPALQLRDHLAARLEELNRLAAEPAAGETLAVAATVPTLPVPLRLAVIVGISLALWLAIGLAVAAVL